MIRPCFNVASTLSLLLTCIIAAAWAWGHITPRACRQHAAVPRSSLSSE
jgi:hypothetical protein